ncbi:MAG: 50S ribosomal protein L10 [Proteobacteria bacterium]|nr:50S ribosomal protein L10 [Pseudomonadota bacterium]MDA1357830.1 50S ribosomal protein L10 [Pseudomonadota bacterium]
MDRTQKEKAVTGLREVFESAHLVVVTQFSGLTVAEATDLRSKMRDAGANFRVTKNRLALRALEGTTFKDISGLFTGATAIAYSKDAVAAARVAVEYAKKNNKLVVVGGALDGDMLNVDRVRALAALPSLDQLRGQLVGLIQAPATRIAGVVQAPAAQLARVLNAYAEKSEAA